MFNLFSDFGTSVLPHDPTLESDLKQIQNLMPATNGLVGMVNMNPVPMDGGNGTTLLIQDVTHQQIGNEAESGRVQTDSRNAGSQTHQQSVSMAGDADLSSLQSPLTFSGPHQQSQSMARTNFGHGRGIVFPSPRPTLPGNQSSRQPSTATSTQTNNPPTGLRTPDTSGRRYRPVVRDANIDPALRGPSADTSPTPRGRGPSTDGVDENVE